MTITVEHPGALTTVQDLGRPGYAAMGVSRSGAADRGSAARAHRLLGNDPAAALLETVLGGLRLHTDRAETVVVTGAATAVTIGDRRHPGGRTLHWPVGTTFAVDPPAAGLRSYLAVRGGFDVAAVLGSRSTDTLGGIGPAPLIAGDTLTVGGRTAGPVARHDAPTLLPGSDLTLDVTPGPRADWFDLEGLLDRPWEVTADLDRVGVRLDGTPLRRRRDGELPSEGLVRGAVQVPPAGRPVVFGPDHPTTGGYPVVAVLTDAASDRLAQARPGTVVRFRLRGARPPLG